MKKYNGLICEEDFKLFDEMIELMLDEEGDGECGLNEIVSVICGEEFYGDYDEEDLKYVKEVIFKFKGIEVGFNLEYESMFVEEVDI